MTITEAQRLFNIAASAMYKLGHYRRSDRMRAIMWMLDERGPTWMRRAAREARLEVRAVPNKHRYGDGPREVRALMFTARVLTLVANHVELEALASTYAI